MMARRRSAGLGLGAILLVACAEGQTRPPVVPVGEAASSPTPSAASAASPPSAPSAEPSFAPTSDPAPRPGPAPSSAPARTVMGRLAAKVGAQVTLRTTDTRSVAAGQKGHVYRRLEHHDGSLDISAWLHVADVTVKSVGTDRLVVVVDDEKSILRINGKKVETFPAGADLKLDLGP
jgi:hypothetical protein